MKGIWKIFCIAALVTVAACNEQPQAPAVDANGQPVAQQQQPAGGVSPWLAGIGGFMLGNMMGHRNAPAPTYAAPSTTTTVNRTVVNKTVIVQQAPKPVPKPMVQPPKQQKAYTPPPVSRPAPSYRPNYSAPSRSSYSSSRSSGRR